MKPRLQDVAEHAGVSMKTVSNVVNGYQHVSARTRTRVLAAIEELGYQPNLSARNLARGRTGVIALVVPRLDMPYFAALAGHLVDAAQAAGWVVLIEQTAGEADAERQAISGALSRRVDGLVFSPLHLPAAEIADRADRTPLILLGEQAYGGGAPHIVIDNEAAGRTATEHLIGLGRRRLAMIGVSVPRSRNPRYRGFRTAARAAGLSVDPRHLRSVRDNRGSDGEQAMDAMIASGVDLPDGLFCSTDWLALGAIRSLVRHGLRVPEDVAVVGFDDIPYGEAATPSLTTISPDRRRIARLAVDLLSAAATASAPADPVLHEIDYRLVVRESTVGRLPA